MVALKDVMTRILSSLYRQTRRSTILHNRKYRWLPKKGPHQDSLLSRRLPPHTVKRWGQERWAGRAPRTPAYQRRAMILITLSLPYTSTLLPYSLPASPPPISATLRAFHLRVHVFDNAITCPGPNSSPPSPHSDHIFTSGVFV
ncbi:hypothetical protein E2C01_017753 [Portunus trituberculatus]|uniref:Uncharacterized protein n=1 Tax=Portunus trituberculatus TaxID=210409 RepID=A0A5B7DTQ8_PORTR|nr:hypothetical protein [Portunus trituberculatus]